MSKIKTYNDLLAEQKRLEAHLEIQKEIIQSEMAIIKGKFEPFIKIASWLGIAKSKGAGNSLLKMGAEAGIDFLIGQNLLSKSNWLAKLIIPFILKRFTNKAIEKSEPSTALS
jgi:hypothetical protein